MPNKVRGGRKISCIAPTANAQALAAAASVTYTFQILEPCQLDRLTVSAFSDAAIGTAGQGPAYDGYLDAIEVSAFQLDGDTLISGSPSAKVYNADAAEANNPFLGQYVDQRSVLTITLTNRSAVTGLVAGVAISVR